MEPGDTIPLEQTTPAVNLTALFDGFRPLFTTLNPEDVNKLADSLIKVLQGESGTVQQLVRDIGSLTNTLADRDQVIGEVIDNLTAVLDTINNREDQFDQLVVNTSSLIEGLSADSEAIGSSRLSRGSDVGHRQRAGEHQACGHRFDHGVEHRCDGP